MREPEAIIQEAKASFVQGLQQFIAGDFLEAIASFNQTLTIQPNSAEAWYFRGGALGGLQRYAEAITSYNRAIAIKPDHHSAWIEQGLALDNLQQYEEALKSYGQALTIEPNSSLAWYNQGITLNKLQQYEEAINSFNQAIRVHGDWGNRSLGHAWADRGAALSNIQRYKEALNSYGQALQSGLDNSAIALHDRGAVLYKLQRYEKAIASFDCALALQPDFYQAWISRGTVAGSSVKYEPQFAFSKSPVTKNPVLKQRGYKGELASYEEGFKYIYQDTHPEGWGKLHQAIGNAHYGQGWPFPYWRKAVKSYNKALKTITAEAFPEAHLEVLQDLIRTYLGLRTTEKAAALLRRGSDLLRRLLNDPKRSDWSKCQLALRFTGLRQLTVDMYIQSGQLVKALITAEKDKNACLSWLLGAWSNDIPTPSWVEIQQLLNSSTAFVYWHLSPAALTTFILKHNGSEPILITTHTLTNEEEPPASVQRLREFENWVKDWNQQYTDYRSKTRSKENHSWREGMEGRLEKLKNILNIPEIEEELKGIQQLILIPHRDLHRFPIHALFCDSCDFTITYLPSAQIGINLQQRQPNPSNHLLSVEDPDETLNLAKFESEVISQMFDNGKRLQSKHASKKQVEEALSAEYSIFHFTGHGIHNFRNPEKSELALADGEKLTLEEISKKNLKIYNLVTLSACETAITGNQTITTEYVGLVSGFLRQGVAYVVSTLWTVESAATALVMIEFYRRWKADKSKAVALAEATQWLRHLTVQQLKEWYEALLAQLPPKFSLLTETELYKLGMIIPTTGQLSQLQANPVKWTL